LNIIVAEFDEAFKASVKIVDVAKKLLEEVSIPKTISSAVVKRYFRKALRCGVWRNLKAEQKALLLVLKMWRGSVRSKTLQEIVKNIFLEIELSTFRGKALLFGVAIAIKKKLYKTISNPLKNIGYILATGIMYLNNPPIYRIYG